MTTFNSNSISTSISTDGFISSMAFDPTNTILVIGDLNGDLSFYLCNPKSWNTAPTKYFTLNVFPRVNFKPISVRCMIFIDNNRLIAGGKNGSLALVSCSPTSAKVQSILDSVHSSPVSALRFVPFFYIASGDDCGHLKVWKIIANGLTLYASFKAHADWGPISGIISLPSKLKGFDPKSSNEDLVIASSGDGTISTYFLPNKTWELFCPAPNMNQNHKKRNLSMIKKSQEMEIDEDEGADEPLSIARPPSNVLSSCDAPFVVGTDSGNIIACRYEVRKVKNQKDSICITDTKKFQQFHDCEIDSVAFIPNFTSDFKSKSFCVAGCSDGWLRVLDPISGTFIGVLGQHSGTDEGVFQLLVSSDGQVICSAGYDGKLHLWNTSSFRVLQKSAKSTVIPDEDFWNDDGDDTFTSRTTSKKITKSQVNSAHLKQQQRDFFSKT